MLVAAVPIELGKVPAMCSKQGISCPAVFLILIFTAATVLAQTSIDDVHVTPREGPVTLATAAYPPGTSAFSDGALIRARADLVMVPVTITDGMNRPVVGLEQDNFQVFENKKAQEIKNFSSEDAPISVGFIVDTSGSMAYKLERARDAVIQFCETANPQDEFFMVTFADAPRLATDFTTRTEKIENDLLGVRSQGRTALLDAIYMGLRRMHNARYSRRALIILSDGGDNHSRFSEHDVRSAVKESDVLIYAIGIYERYVNTEEELLGPELLRSITSLTGGQAFTLTNVNDMPAVTRAIGSQLRHQYMLAYEPQTKPKDGKWHKISVKLRLPREFHNLFLHIDARTGYYAGEE
jgi:Ca-activated chloride channel homolog